MSNKLTQFIFGGVIVGGVSGFFFTSMLTSPQAIEVEAPPVTCHEKGLDLIEQCIDQENRYSNDECMRDGTVLLEHCHRYHEGDDDDDDTQPPPPDVGGTP